MKQHIQYFKFQSKICLDLGWTTLYNPVICPLFSVCFNIVISYRNSAATFCTVGPQKQEQKQGRQVWLQLKGEQESKWANQSYVKMADGGWVDGRMVSTSLLPPLPVFFSVCSFFLQCVRRRSGIQLIPLRMLMNRSIRLSSSFSRIKDTFQSIKKYDVITSHVRALVKSAWQVRS